ncbi:MAG: methanogenesis marker 7 protein [Euryarchaeota archaeon]|nr:methanogenesis marker 7 protein [Euryarchaeota archaeon]
MLEPIMYEGGVFKHNLVIELIEDLGGYVLQTNFMQTEVMIQMLCPHEDISMLEDMAKELRAKITRAPLTGTDIIVISPTLAYHHLPHHSCDVAEYMRRFGANTTLIGLARGVGRRIAQISAKERVLVNEHDLAVFALGNFEDCLIKKKYVLYKDLEVPCIITGTPELPEPPMYAKDYVGHLGRIAHRLKLEGELDALDRLVETVGKTLDEHRIEISKDPLTTQPARLMKEIKEQIPEINKSLSPSPITLQLMGARVKLSYPKYKEAIENITFEEGVTLREIAKVLPSEVRDYMLIRILPKSVTGFVI